MEQNLNDKTACLVTAFQSGDVSAFSTKGGETMRVKVRSV